MRELALLFLIVVSLTMTAVAGYRLLRAYRAGMAFLSEYLLLVVWLALLILCLFIK